MHLDCPSAPRPTSPSTIGCRSQGIQPRQFAWLLHSSGSLLSLPEPNGRPLDYLHATRRLYGHALPFWWDGSQLVQTADIDQLIARMQTACAELQCKAEELL